MLIHYHRHTIIVQNLLWSIIQFIESNITRHLKYSDNQTEIIMTEKINTDMLFIRIEIKKYI